MDDADVLFIQMEDPFASVLADPFEDVKKEEGPETSEIVGEIKIEPEIIINDALGPVDAELKVKPEKEQKNKATSVKEKSKENCIKIKNEIEILKPPEVPVKNEIEKDDAAIVEDVKKVVLSDLEFDTKFEPLDNVDDEDDDDDDDDYDDNDDDDYHDFDADITFEPGSSGKKIRRKRRKKIANSKPVNGKYECCFCKDIFPKMKLLKKHSLKLHSNENKFECDICMEEFQQYLFIKRHMNKHTIQKPQCKFCGRTFSSVFTLKRHMVEHDSSTTYRCEICQKLYENAFKLKKHMKSHTTPKTFPCDICEKPFQSAYLMKFHRVIHSGKKEYACDVCGKAFTQLPTLHRHKFLHISDSEKNFFCEVCAKKFPAAYLLKAHMLIHRPPSNCPHCEKSFLLPSGLKIHIKAVHSGDNPYKCKICDKVFTQSSTMFRHMNLHNRSKEYVCDDCGKVFNVFYYLRKHIANVHSRAFTCELCSKSFTKPHKLSNHMARCHTYKQPHLRISRKDIRECYICARGFNYNGLSRHIVRCKKGLSSTKPKVKQPADAGKIYFIPNDMGTQMPQQPLAQQPIQQSVQESLPQTLQVPLLQQQQQAVPQPSVPNENILPVEFTTETKTKSTNRYKCHVCNIAVSQSSTLTRHMKIHTRELYKCNLCNTEFNRAEQLDKHHTDVHNPSKPFLCEVCKRTFSHMQTMEMHVSIHVPPQHGVQQSHQQ